MTDQEKFDFIVTHLFKQGERSMMDNGINCAYRGTNNRKCAIGCLFPDEVYKEEMERKGGQTLLDDHPDLRRYIDWNKIEIWMQMIHDDPVNWVATQIMHNALKHAAEKCWVSPKILETLSFSDR